MSVSYRRLQKGGAWARPYTEYILNRSLSLSLSLVQVHACIYIYTKPNEARGFICHSRRAQSIICFSSGFWLAAELQHGKTLAKGESHRRLLVFALPDIHSISSRPYIDWSLSSCAFVAKRECVERVLLFFFPLPWRIAGNFEDLNSHKTLNYSMEMLILVWGEDYVLFNFPQLVYWLFAWSMLCDDSITTLCHTYDWIDDCFVCVCVYT